MNDELRDQLDLVVEVVLLFAALVVLVLIFNNTMKTSEKFVNASIQKANIKSEYELEINKIENGTRVKFAQFQEGFVLKEAGANIKVDTSKQYLIKDISDGEVKVEVIK